MQGCCIVYVLHIEPLEATWSCDVGLYNWNWLHLHVSTKVFLFPTEIFLLTGTLKELTVCSPCVEISDIVVEADSDGGEAHLPLQTSYQPVVQRLGPLRSDHGADCAKHPSVTDPLHGFLLSLNLGSRVVLNAKNQEKPSDKMVQCVATQGSIIQGYWGGQS